MLFHVCSFPFVLTVIFFEKMQHCDFVELIATVARRMYMCGAETRLIIQTSERIAAAFGYKAVVIVNSCEISVKLLYCESEDLSKQKECTTFMRIDGHGIDMNRLIFYTHLCHDAEQGIITPEELQEKLEHIPQFPYSRTLLVIAVGIATAAYSAINGGNLAACVTALIAGAVTMTAKELLKKYHLFEMFVFTICGMISTLSSFYIGNCIFELDKYNLAIAMVVSLLILVPGFQFVNGILDLFKGYTAVGATRLINTVMLIASVCLGIMIAFSMLPINNL